MNPLDYLSEKLKTAIANLYTCSPDAPLVTPPTDRSKAHYSSNIAFTLAKTLKKSPLQICEELANALNSDDYFEISFLAPGFLNFNLKDTAAHNLLAAIAENGQYGANDILKNQNWAIEHTSPNPNKAMHLGHLRNNLVGMSLAALVEFCGANTTRDWIDNDRGIAISKAMLGYLLSKRKNEELEPTVEAWFDNPKGWLLPSDNDDKPDHFVGDCYVLASDAIKQDESLKDYASELTVRWEANDEPVRALWKLIIGLGHKGQAETLKRLGNHWDHAWHEHEHYLQGKDLVKEGLKKGIFKRLEDGAILTCLENYNLPDTILQKSDGTSLYITQDLALTKLKKDKYKADRLFWVIGPEQSVAMKQVFAVCEQLGIGKLSDFSHIPYGLVSILDEDGKKKKMSSRGGETIYIDDLLNAVKTSLLDNNERGYSNQEAEKIAVAAIKFALLSLGRMTDTAISIEKILNQNGDTGVYVLYTRARLLSLLSKSIEENPQTVEELANPSFSRPPQTVTTVAAGDGASPRNDGSDPYSVRENDGLQVPPRTEALTSNEKLDFSAEEKNLIALLTYLPEIIKTSLEDLTTNRLADFLLDLSHAFNHLYATERFITEDQAETAKKLLLTRAALQAFNSALKILSITPVEKI